MALTGWAVGNYLNRAAAVMGANPFLISAWGYLVSTPGADGIYASVGTLTSNGDVLGRLMVNTTPRVRADTRTAADATALATLDTPLSEWHHAAASYVSGTSREAWLNGANKGTNATSMTPAAPNNTRIGVSNNALAPFPSTSGLAEVSFWDLTGFTSTNRDDLVARLAGLYSPLFLNAETGQPWSGKLRCYVLDSTNTLTDLSGTGNTFTQVGSLSNFTVAGVSSHPLVGGVPMYLTSNVATGSNHGRFSDTAPGASTSASGWTVGATVVDRYARMAFGVERAAATFGSTAQPDGNPDNTLGDCYRSELALTRDYDAGNWFFQFPVRAATLSSGQDGRLRVRVWRSTSATGASPTEITSGASALSIVTNVSTSADGLSTGAVSLGAFSLIGEYLFVQLAWHITGVAAATISHASVTQGASTSNVATYDTASVTLTSGRLYVLSVVSSDAAPETDPTGVATVTGGITFTKHVAGISHDTIASNLKKLSLWRVIPGSTVTSAIRITLPDAGTGATWLVEEFSGAIDTTTPLGTAATNSGNAVATLSATPGALVSTSSLQYAVGANDLNNTTNNEPSGTNWVEVNTAQTFNTPPTSIAAALNSSGTASQVTFGTTAADRAVIAVEIRADTSVSVATADVLLRLGSNAKVSSPRFVPPTPDTPPEPISFGYLTESFGFGAM